MSVNRNRITSSYAEEREALGPLPWVLSPAIPGRRREGRWVGHAIALLAGVAVAYMILRAGL